MIKNFDGIYLNPNYISSIVPTYKSNTYRDCYKIRFTISPDTFDGNTEFNTEKECRLAIEELLHDIN